MRFFKAREMQPREEMLAFFRTYRKMSSIAQEMAFAVMAAIRGPDVGMMDEEDEASDRLLELHRVKSVTTWPIRYASVFADDGPAYRAKFDANAKTGNSHFDDHITAAAKALGLI